MLQSLQAALARPAGTLLLFASALLAAAPASAIDTNTARLLELDVPYVPTPDKVVRRMLDMAAVQPTDFVVDLGAGDGRIAVTAARDYGARGAFGVDIDPQRIREARENARQAKVEDRVEFAEQDLFKTDFSHATVLTMYLLPDVNLRLRPVILDKLAPGTRVVSHAFTMGDWESDAQDRVDDRYSLYLWVVPAKLAGSWRIQDGDRAFDLILEQDFQRLEGHALIDGAQVPVRDGYIRGREFRYTLGEGESARRYAGRLVGNGEVLAIHEPDAQRGWRGQRR